MRARCIPRIGTVRTHPPRAFPAARGELHFVSSDPQIEQFPATGSRSLPLFPVVETHPSSDPLVKVADFGKVHSDHVVVESSPGVERQFLDHLPG